MGAWGVYSCANDSTHDVLDKFFNNDKKMTQVQADKCIKRIYTNKIGSWMDDDDYRLVKLGCVVFVLLEGLQVSVLILRKALALADEHLLPDKLSGWIKGRKEAIEDEITMITEAIDRGGKALKRTIKMIADKISRKKKPAAESKIKDLLKQSIIKGCNILWISAASRSLPVQGKVVDVVSRKRGKITINTIHVDLGYRIVKVNNTNRLVVIDKLL